jgi:hypothetical protein
MVIFSGNRGGGHDYSINSAYWRWPPGARLNASCLKTASPTIVPAFIRTPKLLQLTPTRLVGYFISIKYISPANKPFAKTPSTKTSDKPKQKSNLLSEKPCK